MKGVGMAESRRTFLSMTAAGLAAPLLQACGGGDSVAQLPLPTGAYPDYVPWMREDLLNAIGTGDSVVSVALLDRGRVVFSEAFGYANRETGLQATVDTRMNIGSVAKIFTALAVMILRDRGRLSLDQPVVELMDDFSMRSPEFTKVTVRHLLNHSSGFPGTNYQQAINFAWLYGGYDTDTVNALSRSRLKHEPGELSVYCNDGFTLLGYLVGRLSGQHYEGSVQHKLPGPWAWTHRGFW